MQLSSPVWLWLSGVFQLRSELVLDIAHLGYLGLGLHELFFHGRCRGFS